MSNKTNALIQALVLALALVAGSAVTAQDAVQTDPDHYTVIFENDRVRVLDYKDVPGDATEMHAHPAFVVYAMTAFQRKLTLPDGKELNRSFEPGQVLYSEAQTHKGENVGTTPTHIIMVELK